MANRITNRAYSDSDSFKMNNGLTSVFIDVLALSASALASTEREKRFAVWLACHDQTICGIGAVGFDISDMPWTTRGFQSQKSFLLKVIQSAQSKEYWRLLGYHPREDWILSSLERFRLLIAHFPKEGIIPEAKRRQAAGMPSFFMKCPKHQVYVHQQGCVLCNDSWDGRAWRFPQDDNPPSL